MKLAIFINDLSGGGAERVTATLANYWARKQWDVTIITLGPQSLDFYPLEPMVRRISLDLAGDSANVLDAILQNVRRVMALRRTILQLRPKVVLSMMNTSNVLLALACHNVPGVCAIGSERSYPPRFPLGTIWNAMRARMYGRLSAVVALTHECADWIREHSSATYVPVIPNPASWPLPDNQPRLDPHGVCAPGRKILLAVGRLSREKNVESLIGVFSRLMDQHPEWDLVVLGEGPERTMLESIIWDNHLERRIFLPGIVGNVGAWYCHADLFVMTSHFEGFPNALAEALAHGLPAVSFDCDTGPRDIIRDGVDGVLVKAGDVYGLQLVLDRVMADEQLRAQMAFCAIDARSRFSIDRIAAMWEELFNKLSHAEVTATDSGTHPANSRSGYEC